MLSKITLVTTLVVIVICSAFLFTSHTLAFHPTNYKNRKPPVISVNHPPVANVGPGQTVNENTTVILFGLAVDPDPNDKVTYSWNQIAGPAVILKGSNTAAPTFTAPTNIPSDIELKFALTAKDNEGALSNPAIVTIKVKHVNHPPIANAGLDQTVNAGYIATLDGSKSKDPDIGDTLTYSWIQIAGPHVTLIDANSPIATFTAPKNISSDTQMIFKLTVKDSENATSTDNVKVTDKYIPPANHPPIANAGSNQTAHVGDTVGLDGRGSSDPDGSIASYSWMQTSGPAVTLNGADTPTPTFTAPTVSNDTMLKFLLTVKDNRGAASTNSAIVSVTVKAVQKPSRLKSAPSNVTGAAKSCSTGLQKSDSFFSYKNSSFGITIQYPSTWMLNDTHLVSANYTYGIYHEIAEISPRIANIRPSFSLSVILIKPNATLDAYLANTIQSYRTAFPNFTLISLHAKNIYLACNLGYEIRYSFDSKPNKVLAIEIGTIIDGKLYEITYLADAKQYYIFLPNINKMIGSLRININELNTKPHVRSHIIFVDSCESPCGDAPWAGYTCNNCNSVTQEPHVQMVAYTDNCFWRSHFLTSDYLKYRILIPHEC